MASEQTNTGERELDEHVPPSEYCPSCGANCQCGGKSKQKPEEISNAKRYGGWAVYDFIVAMELNFALGNVVKYISRAGKKDGATVLVDLKKARTYLDKHIETLENGEKK